MNINMKNHSLGVARSVIREIFEYGNQRAAIVGRENVYDFSLGNPSVPSPSCIDETIAKLVKEDTIPVHSYTSAQGAPATRKAISDSINRRFDETTTPDDIYITCGAAASLTVTLNALCNCGDEVIAFAPFFPEYKVFAEGAGANFKIVPAAPDFQINFDALEETITENTKALIINSPNNPSGAVLTEETIVRLSKLLTERSNQYGHPIYLISDEPYRELVYDNTVKVPYITKYYDNTFVCYSYSKSLSLPGERIGYILVCNRMENARDVYAAVCGAGRMLGFVCAPSLMQKVVEQNPEAVSDISVYKQNRDLLYNALTEYGYECINPDGAFYLFVKSPMPDAKEFCEKAKALDLLLIPSDSFGCEGYIRISYCVSTDMIKRSLPLFKRLMD
ncbi:MAG: pyridoxal phosphate-dependent aminotransferase [Clostridia bacterium]|nr:pyridoxal phosphate-dependent aminotransferase [Clostridia bacterium]